MNSTRCASCRFLRRRCGKDCILAPYFPASDPERFHCVHKIFGASNISRMLQQIPVEKRKDAAKSMAIEAACRVRSPVYGISAEINSLLHQINAFQCELATTKAQIAMLAARDSSQNEQVFQSDRLQDEDDGAQFLELGQNSNQISTNQPSK